MDEWCLSVGTGRAVVTVHTSLPCASFTSLLLPPLPPSPCPLQDARVHANLWISNEGTRRPRWGRRVHQILQGFEYQPNDISFHFQGDVNVARRGLMAADIVEAPPMLGGPGEGEFFNASTGQRVERALAVRLLQQAEAAGTLQDKPPSKQSCGDSTGRGFILTMNAMEAAVPAAPVTAAAGGAGAMKSLVQRLGSDLDGQAAFVQAKLAQGTGAGVAGAGPAGALTGGALAGTIIGSLLGAAVMFVAGFYSARKGLSGPSLGRGASSGSAGGENTRLAGSSDAAAGDASVAAAAGEDEQGRRRAQRVVPSSRSATAGSSSSSSSSGGANTAARE